MLLLCTPVYRSLESACHPAMRGTVRAIRDAGLARPEWLYRTGPEVRRNRNGLVRAALGMTGWDALLWIDGDTSCALGVVEGMLAADKEIIGAGYPVRGDPRRMDAVVGGVYPRADYRGLTEADWVGGGLLLTSRAALEQIPKPWFRNRMMGEYWDQTPEDIGFCQHAREQGLEVWLLGIDGVTHHDMGGEEPTDPHSIEGAVLCNAP